MNILIVNTLDRGGAAKACIRLHQGLLKEGVHSKLLLRQQSHTDIPETYEFAFSPGSKLDFVKQKVVGYQISKSKQKALTKRPKGFEPFRIAKSPYPLHLHPLFEWADIVNLHWVTDFLDEASFFDSCRKPLVWTLHDMLPFTGGFHYKQGFPIDAYQDLIERNLSLKKKAYAGASMHIVAPSKWLMNQSAASPLFSSFPHHNIPYGIDTEIFKSQNPEFSKEVLGLPKDKKIVLFVADSLANKRKGVHFLVEAIESLPSDIALGFVGSDHLQINHSSCYPLGRIYDERLMAMAYSAADLFVIPSIEDNLPNTVIESLCCGTPVVGFDIGGVPDMVQPGLNGFLCPEISSGSLSQTIQKALNHPFDTNAIRENAHEKYDESVQAKAYQELYDSLLA
ncbi:MAG: glycosyltransferase [Bacteroidota bacterium]